MWLLLPFVSSAKYERLFQDKGRNISVIFHMIFEDAVSKIIKKTSCFISWNNIN